MIFVITVLKMVEEDKYSKKAAKVITAQKEQHDGATAKINSVRQTEKDICQRSTQSVVLCSITLTQPQTKTFSPLAR